jgi:glycosyltransferase involved in cell wall biosynthesis
MSISQRIIFVTSIHAFGGVERLILALSRFLYDNGLPHSVVCMSDTINFAKFAEWPMSVQVLTAERNSISEGFALHRFFRGIEFTQAPLLFDLKGAFYAGMFGISGYHIHLTDPPSLLPSEISKYAFSVSQNGSNLLVRPTLLKRLRGEFAHQLNRRGARKAESVIAMTHTIADELRKLYSVDAVIVRPGVKLPSVLVKHSQQGKLHMLSVCRLEPNKRLDWILNALAKLESSGLSSRVDWMLDVVGDGSQLDGLKILSARLGIDQRVLFHGRIPDVMVEEVFADASIFLMPAVQGYGLPALEALSRGVAVVLHKESGVSEILQGNPWVEIIEDGIDELVQALGAARAVAVR